MTESYVHSTLVQLPYGTAKRGGNNGKRYDKSIFAQR